MIEFGKPVLLLLFIPWTILILFFLMKQKKSFQAVIENISSRFLKSFTYYNKYSLTIHVLIIFIMGAALIVSAASPQGPGHAEKEVKTGNIIFVIDASFSMVSLDTNVIDGREKSKSRLREACIAADMIVKKLPEYRFGLISYSGVSAYHSPPTTDLTAIQNLLENLQLHSFQKTGTNFKAALSGILHLVEHSKGQGFQVVLISDGEAKDSDDYKDELELLKRKKIPVHTIGVGTEKGGGIVIYNPEEIIQGKTNPNTVKEINTYREEKYLKDIARKTNGYYLNIEKEGTVQSVIDAIVKRTGQGIMVKKTGKVDMSHIFIALFALLFILDIFAFDGYAFWKKLVFPMIYIFLLFSTGCNYPLWKAHKLNEDGISDYNDEYYMEARDSFEKSISYEIIEHIPTYNLANNYFAENNFSMAHKYYERALKIENEFPEALYNDGHALYAWGLSELDKDFCNIERASILWQKALDRFNDVRIVTVESVSLNWESRGNIEFIEKQIKMIKQKNLENREKCSSGSSGKSGKSGKSDEEDKKDKNQSGDPEKNKDKGSSKDDKPEKDKSNAAPLTFQEKLRIKEELDRIKKDEGQNIFKQTKPQQLRKGKDRQNVGKEIFW